MRKTWILSLLILLSAASHAHSSLQAQSIEDYADWITHLSAEYKVAQGNAYLPTNSPLDESIFRNFFGENHTAPCIIPQPPVNHSYVDPYYATALETPGPNGAITDIIYKLSDQDALVTIVSYPPKAAYFGYQSYVFTRHASHYVGITPPHPRTVSPNPDRYEIFGSIGNAVNHVIVQNQYGAQPWNEAVVMHITTSNRKLAHALIRKAEAYGISRESIFVEPIGSNVITGTGRAADDLVTLIRYAIPQTTSDANDWINNLSKNVLVYKVTNRDLPMSRYGENTYTTRTVNYNETGFSPSLRAALIQLAKVLQTYLADKQSSEAASKHMMISTQDNSEGIPCKGLVGSYGIQYGVLCAGDNQDTSTYATLTLKTLGAKETAFIAGVNHNVPSLNNSSYVSLDIHNVVNALGVASSSQTNPKAVGFNKGNLTGSAKAVLKALGIEIPRGYVQLQKEIDRLYVAALARDTANPTIAAACKYCIDLKGTSLIRAGKPISIAERTYIVPNTTTGGNVNYMLYPIIIAAAKDF